MVDDRLMRQRVVALMDIVLWTLLHGRLKFAWLLDEIVAVVEAVAGERVAAGLFVVIALARYAHAHRAARRLMVVVDCGRGPERDGALVVVEIGVVAVSA